MPVFKCKMCGGSLEVTEGMTVCECEYCGTTQTLPKTDNEQSLNLFNRANHFRQQCEFDKAAEIYEKMTVQSGEDAELYWSLVLCRYGIEYVDDPLTHKKIATCHRTQFKSILDDPDYQTALQYADFAQRSVYEREAAYIDKVQKGILEISNKEQPFDVFICYKETDERGRRTPDSVLAQELYYGLTQEGFKVFFSRITLESKLGIEYEPYIFAALNSAKVMVVVGTKPEYFNAVWVRNEWSRYLMLMQEDRSRTLIPAYKDMDPYDLPDALSMFQAQDMSKLGFLQDLIYGIKKINSSNTIQPDAQTTLFQQLPVNSTSKSLLKRAALFLEAGDWSNVTEYCNRILDQEPECALAYLYLVMAEKKLNTEEELLNIGFLLAENQNYKFAIRFADNSLRNRLEGYITDFEKRKEKAIKIIQYYLEQKKEGPPTERLNKIEHDIDSLNTRLSQIPDLILNKKRNIENINIERLRSKYNEVVSEKNKMKEECETLEKNIEELKNKHDKMGFFQKKAKERTGLEILTLESTKQSIFEKIQSLDKKESEINRAIYECLI